MFQSVLGRFKPQPKNYIHDVTCSVGDSAEKEEDGFLLIGQTPSDRSTITHQQFTANEGSSRPPDYSRSGSDFPPAYEAALTTGMAALSPFSADPVPANNNHMLPISDIPFQLAPQLTVLQRLSSCTGNLTNQQMTFDWSKYDYDFSFELSYLKEHGIDDIQKYERNTMAAGRNLIQF